MKSKKFYFALLASVMLAGTMTMTGCSASDNAVDIIDNPEAVNGEPDILKGKLYYVFNTNKLESYKIPVATLGELDIKVLDDTDNYGFRQEVIDGERYIVPYLKNEEAPAFELVRVKVESKGEPARTRHALLVFVNPAKNAQTRAVVEDGWESEYSKRIGQTTYPWEKTTYSKRNLFLSDSINNLDLLSRANGDIFNFDEYFLVNTNSTKSIALMFECESIQQTMESWQEQVGASLSFSGGKVKQGYMMNSAFNESVHQTEMSSNSYEFCLAVDREEQAFLQMHMENFEKENNTSRTLADNFLVLSYITSNSFAEDCYDESAFNDNFTAEKMFDKWGTDVITQGTFGGLYANLYGRAHNVYETSIGTDLMASGGFEQGDTTKVDSGANNQWLKIFYEKQNYKELDSQFDFNYEEDHYSEATAAFSVELTLGSEPESGHDAWVSGLKNKDKWALISYRVSDSDSTKCYLYPIEQVAQNLLDGFRAAWKDYTLDENTESILKRMQKRIDKMRDAREDYIIDNMYRPIKEHGRIVLADFMMVTGKDNQPAGHPKPLIMYCDFEGRYRMYLPMMHNYKDVDSEYDKPITPTPLQMGYAMETSGNDYYNAYDSKDHLWYYALDYEENAQGIVNIVFAESKKGFVRRGHHADEGIELANTDNYVYLRLYDPDMNGADPMKKITAVGLCDDDKRWNNRPGGILGSTGGSELSEAYTVTSVYNAWKTFWTGSSKAGNDSEETGYKNKTYYGNVKDYIWNEGGAAGHEWQFGPVFSSKTLNIDRINRETIPRIKLWTDEKLY